MFIVAFIIMAIFVGLLIEFLHRSLKREGCFYDAEYDT
jgi:hypothetical protein